MALSYDMTKLDIASIPEWFETVEYGTDGYSNYALFEALVFRLMSIRSLKNGEITIANVREVIERSATMETVFGLPHIPADFIRRMIGLKTNVFPRITTKAFMTDVMESVMRDARVRVSRENEWIKDFAIQPN